MGLPAQYAWLEPIILSAIVVFVITLIGNVLSFKNRVVNALVTALVFAIIFGGLVYTGFDIGPDYDRAVPGRSVPVPK